MPQWNTTDRGVMRESETSYTEQTDWDGKSCADHEQLPDRGMRGVEDMTMLQGLASISDADAGSE